MQVSWSTTGEGIIGVLRREASAKQWWQRRSEGTDNGYSGSPSAVWSSSASTQIINEH